MGTLLVYGGEVLTPFEAIVDGAVFARDGAIEQVGPRAAVAGEADIEIDAGGRIICPGFVDLQVNGGGGVFLTEDPSVDAVERIAGAHVRFGTTAMLPTVVTADEPAMARALAAVKESAARPPEGRAASSARVLGGHLEGPFINPIKKGAHDERFVQRPDRSLLERLLNAAGGSLRLITLAPELPGADELIQAARQASAVVAVGHSDATFGQARRAFDAGVSLGTHLFNAMRGLQHREPGVVGALLEDERVVVTVIADGVHVHPAVLSLVARTKGPARTALVTDAMAPVGTDQSMFRYKDTEIRVRDGACYTSDGILAGSTLSMNQAVRTMHALAGVPLIDCIAMATATPARVLGMDEEIGVLRPGARADLVVCDREMNVSKVFVGGTLAYDGDSR